MQMIHSIRYEIVPFLLSTVNKVPFFPLKHTETDSFYCTVPLSLTFRSFIPQKINDISFLECSRCFLLLNEVHATPITNSIKKFKGGRQNYRKFCVN